MKASTELDIKYIDMSSYLRIKPLCFFFLFVVLFPFGLKAQADSLKTVQLPSVRVEAKLKTLSYQERRKHWRRIRDVKKVLPYARYITAVLIETYEYLETLPVGERKAHLKRVKRDMKGYFEPLMRKLTIKQGQLLMKLLHRESGSISYDLVKAFVGGFKAWYWQAFARFVGTNLKAPYEPKINPNDALTERIVLLVDKGWL